MSANLILRINEDANPICLYTYDAQNNSCSVDEIQDWSDTKLTVPELIILVPAGWVYHSKTQIASKNIELLNKSVPFAIEEELSNEVNDNYFAFNLNHDGTQDVVAIEKKLLNQLIKTTEQHNLTVRAIYSEIEWLPQKSDMVYLWRDDSTSLMQIGIGQAMRVANHQISQLLPVFAKNMNRIISNAQIDEEYSGLPVELGLSEADCCQYLLGHSAIDIYVDGVKKLKHEEQSNHWHATLGLVGLLVISWAVIQLIQWNALSQSVERIVSQQRNIIKQQYPDAVEAELIDPYAALQSRLKLQNSQSTGGPDLLIDAVDQLGKTLQVQQVVKLIGMRMIDQKIEIQIMAPSITVINDFHQLLANNASRFNVQIGVNELGEEQVFKSILTMVSR